MFNINWKIKGFAVAIILIGGINGCGSSATTTSTTDTNKTVEEDNLSNESVNSTSLSYKIVDTAQTNCYDSIISGLAKSCGDIGYDANYNGNQPSYTLSSSGKSIRDNITSLVWTQSSDIDGDGQSSDEGDKLSYDDAISYCNNLRLDGYEDWRLPNIKTLYSLILFLGEDPSSYTGSDTTNLITFLDSSFTRAFGDQSASERLIDGQYATTTKYVSTTMNGDETMFGVNFIDGRIKGYPTNMRGTDKKFYVLCTTQNDDYGKNSFIDNGDKTITDNATSLMWTKDDSQSSDFENAISICENSTIAGYVDWRLPNVKELQSIVDYTKSPQTSNSPAIDSIFNSTSFTNEDGVLDWGYYWSGTTHASYGGIGINGSYISFGRGLGNMNGTIMDVHGAGSQRSNAKQNENDRGAELGIDASDGSNYYYKGPQGDIIRIDNMVRCVR